MSKEKHCVSVLVLCNNKKIHEEMKKNSLQLALLLLFYFVNLFDWVNAAELQKDSEITPTTPDSASTTTTPAPSPDSSAKPSPTTPTAKPSPTSTPLQLAQNEENPQPSPQITQPAEEKTQPAPQKSQPAEEKSQPVEKKPAEEKSQSADKKLQPADKKSQLDAKKQKKSAKNPAKKTAKNGKKKYFLSDRPWVDDDEANDLLTPLERYSRRTKVNIFRRTESLFFISIPFSMMTQFTLKTTFSLFSALAAIMEDGEMPVHSVHFLYKHEKTLASTLDPFYVYTWTVNSAWPLVIAINDVIERTTTNAYTLRQKKNIRLLRFETDLMHTDF